jgi:VanZ family protein
MIPLGNEANQSLSLNKLLAFRLDYLAHAIMILCFAWIWVFGRVLGFQGFSVYEFSLIVVAAAIGLELLQLVVPWRSFNPLDMVYNLVGAGMGIGFVVVSQRARKG